MVLSALVGESAAPEYATSPHQVALTPATPPRSRCSPSRPHATAGRIAGMSEPQKKPGVLSWLAIFLAAVVAYVVAEAVATYFVAPDWLMILFKPLNWIRGHSR